jgi:hypothetical protein
VTWVPRREASRRHRHGDGDNLRDGWNGLDDGLEVRERSRVRVRRVWRRLGDGSMLLGVRDEDWGTGRISRRDQRVGLENPADGRRFELS